MPIYELDGVRPDLPAEGDYYVADNAVIIGRIRLRRNSSVWFGSVLRGDNEWIELGEDSNVQESCTLHTDETFALTIGPGTTVGHNVILHGCTIGANTLIGMGAIILNGAKIGNNSLVGAGAVVTEGKEFPDNSLIVGAPARVIRNVDERNVERIKVSAQHYVDRGRQYAKGLRRIG